MNTDCPLSRTRNAKPWSRSCAVRCAHDPGTTWSTPCRRALNPHPTPHLNPTSGTCQHQTTVSHCLLSNSTRSRNERIKSQCLTVGSRRSRLVCLAMGFRSGVSAYSHSICIAPLQRTPAAGTKSDAPDSTIVAQVASVLCWAARRRHFDAAHTRLNQVGDPPERFDCIEALTGCPPSSSQNNGNPDAYDHSTVVSCCARSTAQRTAAFLPKTHKRLRLFSVLDHHGYKKRLGNELIANTEGMVFPDEVRRRRRIHSPAGVALTTLSLAL